MSGNGTKCAYFNCGKTRRDVPNLRMHRFPSQDENRCRKWILNSGNSQLALLEPEVLKTKYICQNHFNDSAYNPAKNRLLKNAVPNPYVSGATEDDFKLLTPTKTYKAVKHACTQEASPCSSGELSPKSKDWLLHLTELPTSPQQQQRKRKLFDVTEGDTPRKKQLKTVLKTKCAKLKNKTIQVSKLKKLSKKINTTSILNQAVLTTKHIHPKAKVLVRMQLLHKKGSPWKKDEKEFAIALYYKSPAAYRFLLKLHIILPAVSTIKSWLGESKFLPGFSSSFFKQLKLKVTTMSEQERVCTICFDEITLKKNLEYSKGMDFIEGFEDLGPLGRQPVLAKEALVFMVRGLYSSWKLPVAYFVSEHGVPSEKRKPLLEKVIQEILQVGLIPKAVICDQATTNTSTFKHLGSTDAKPYFDVNGNKIYTMYDTPHLFKSLRNNLLNGNFVLDDKIINFQDVRDTYDLDQKSTTGRALLKLTPAHMNPNAFQRVTCKLALQVLSRTVAATMRTCVATGDLKSPTASNTAEFIEIADRLFDSLNSRTLFDRNPFRCAVDDRNTLVKEILLIGLEVFRRIEKISFRGIISRPPCFGGIVTTINAVLSLHEDQKNDGFPFLLTSRLNQDILENFFSIVRQKGGYNRNPTVRTFRTIFRSNVIVNLQKPPSSSNCEPDSDLFLNIEQRKTISSPCLDTLVEQSENVSFSDSIDSDDEPTAEDIESPTVLEECATAYFAGYLASKCIKQNKCLNCEQTLLKNSGKLDERRELLILFRMFENKCETSVGLRVPSELMHTICAIGLQIFQSYFDVVQHKMKIKRRLLKKLVLAINNELSDNSVQVDETECGKHRRALLDLLIRTRIFKECKSRSLKKSENSRKMHNRLSILKD